RPSGRRHRAAGRPRASRSVASFPPGRTVGEWRSARRASRGPEASTVLYRSRRARPRPREPGRAGAERHAGGSADRVIEPAAIVIWPDGGVQDFWLLVILSGGIAGGLLLLVRGLREYRTADRLAGIAPSRISSIALGEVLVTGTAEPI